MMHRYIQRERARKSWVVRGGGIGLAKLAWKRVWWWARIHNSGIDDDHNKDVIGYQPMPPLTQVPF